MVDNPAAYPKTSLASIEDFETAFRAHAAAGRDVLCLVFTGKMSGCVGSARNARELVLEDYPDARIEVIDSTAPPPSRNPPWWKTLWPCGTPAARWRRR